MNDHRGRPIFLVQRKKEGAEKPPGELLKNVELVARTVSLIAIPIAVAIGGWWIQDSVNKQNIAKDYATLAIGILEKPAGTQSASLRQLAVDLFSHYSPVPISDELKKELLSGTSGLAQLTASLSGPGLRITSRDGALAAFTDPDTITVVDGKTGRIKWSQELKSVNGITGAVFSPDGSKLYVAVYSGMLSSYAASDGTLIWTKPVGTRLLDVYYNNAGLSVFTNAGRKRVNPENGDIQSSTP